MQNVSFKHIINVPHHAVAREQQANVTFRKVLQAARRIQSPVNRELALYLIQCGVDNADDTIVLEFAAPMEQWDALFRGSVETMLSVNDWLSKVPGTVGQLHATQRQVKAFFAKFGISA